MIIAVRRKLRPVFLGFFLCGPLLFLSKLSFETFANGIYENNSQKLPPDKTISEQKIQSLGNQKEQNVVFTSNNKSVENLREKEGKLDAFLSTIKARAQNETIALVCVDSGYIEMALNLFLSSFTKLGISNYLYVGIDSQVCGLLEPHGVACVTYEHVSDGGSQLSNYGSKAFNIKTHLKTKIVLDSLKAGLKVLLTDLDIVMFKDPFPFFNCSDCDIEITDDHGGINSGFYFARPTKASISLFSKAWETGLRTNGSVDDQLVVGKTLGQMKKQQQIKVQGLSSTGFPNGYIYFEIGKRGFSGENFPCNECVIVHNNWILTAAAKTYRFRETGLWLVDTDGYYSNPDRKYIVFGNPVIWDRWDIKSAEQDALKAAFYIGHLLNRTVILPKFHCYNRCNILVSYWCRQETKHCPLNAHYAIVTFNKYVGKRYREHSFLENPLVPISVKASITEPLLIKSKMTEKTQHVSSFKLTKGKIFKPGIISKGPSKDELITWLAPYENYSVLNFHSLYGLIKMDIVSPSLEKTFSLAFAASEYRQMNLF